VLQTLDANLQMKDVCAPLQNMKVISEIFAMLAPNAGANDFFPQIAGKL
jgi:hypothetical protein